MLCDPTRVGIIVGHHPESKGARFEIEGVERGEYDIWKPFARELARTFKSEEMEGVVIERPNPRPDEALGRKIQRANLDFAFELHFNAVRSASVSGTLMIYRDEHGGSKRLAEVFQNLTKQELGLRNRGTVPRSDLGIIRHTPESLPLILCEPAFGSNPSDVLTLLSELPDLARAYREGARKFTDAVSKDA